MIQKGSTYQFLRDEENPLRSPNTQAVTALLTAGGALAQPGGYTHVMRQENGRTVRNVTWLLEDKKIEISGETITPGEFLRRWKDLSWCRAHPDHPIAWMRAYQGNLDGMRDQIRSQSPQVRITRGGMTYNLTTKVAEDGSLIPDEAAERLLKHLS
jgi:hypothetical protein